MFNTLTDYIFPFSKATVFLQDDVLNHNPDETNERQSTNAYDSLLKSLLVFYAEKIQSIFCLSDTSDVSLVNIHEDVTSRLGSLPENGSLRHE